MPNLRKDHIDYLIELGVETGRLHSNYFSDSDHLGIRYLDPEGMPYKDSKGDDYTLSDVCSLQASPNSRHK